MASIETAANEAAGGAAEPARRPGWVALAARVGPRLPAGRTRWLNWLARRRAPGMFWDRLPAELGGAWYLCDLRDSLAREVCFLGRYAPQETALVRARLSPGATFVDVGANWGYFTLLAAERVGPAGRVVALEPDPRLYAALRRNLERNGWLDRVAALPVAAADRPGTGTLAGFDEHGGNFGLSRLSHSASGAGPAFAVAARPLDDLLDERGLDRVDLLKMDIQGGEALALAGLRRSLAAGRVRRLLLELHPAEIAEHGRSVAELVQELRGFGYRGWAVDFSRAATRRATYARRLEAAGLLRPFHDAEPLDAWAHLYWTAPGVPEGPG
jgi:FkbM family methyltransferase